MSDKLQFVGLLANIDKLKFVGHSQEMTMEAIRADEISKIIRQQIEGFDTSCEISEVGQVIQTGDGIAEIYGLERVMAGELLDLPHEVAGIALNLEEEKVGAGLFGS